MFSFSNLFKKRSNQKSNIDNKVKGYSAFEAGKKYFLNNQFSEAIEQFDKAIENDFLDETFSLRGLCLQGLDFDFDAIEDFTKAISRSPKDCNLYFVRSLSKSAVRDFDGSVADLKSAIYLSKENCELNRAYDDEAKKMGHRYGVTSMYEMRLSRVEMDLKFEIEENERYLKSSPEMKADIQEFRKRRTKVIRV